MCAQKAKISALSPVNIPLEDYFQSDEIFKNAFQYSAVGMALVSLEGKWLKVNSRLCDIVGYSEDELLKLTFQDITYPDDLDMDLKNAKRMIAGKIETYNMEKRYFHKNGGIVWVLLSVSVAKDHNKKPLFLISQIEDITERKRVQHELQESKERYHSLFEDSPISLWEEDFSAVKTKLNQLQKKGVKDFEKYIKKHPEFVDECAALVKILDANDASLKLYNAKNKSELLTSLDKLIANETELQFENELINIAKGLTFFEWEEVSKKLTGELMHIKLTWSVVPGHEEDLSKVMVSIADITHSKKIQEQLQKSEERYRSIVEDMPAMVCRFKEDGTLTFINSFYCDYFKMSHDKLLGSNLFDLIPLEEREIVRQHYLSLNLEKPFITYEYKTVDLDGKENWQKWTDRALFDENGDIIEYQSIGEDITEQKRAEEKLRKSEEHYRRLTENFPNGTVNIYDRDLRMTFVAGSELATSNLKAQDFLGKTFQEIAPAETYEIAKPHLQRAFQGESSTYETPYFNGTYYYVNVAPLYDSNGEINEILVIAQNISERKRAEALLQNENQIMQMIASGAGLHEILNAIAKNVESFLPDTFCSILLLDKAGMHLFHGAAPSLPEEYNNAINGLPIGDNAGSCGTAAYRKERIIVTDVATDPLWDDYRHLVLKHGLRACWSTPIQDEHGGVYGTFAIYYREPRAPKEEEFDLIKGATHQAKIVIEKKQADDERLLLIHELGERVKELTFLHQISRIFMDDSHTEKEVLQEVANAIPAAWQYPNIAVARVGYNGYEFTTPNFKQTDWMQSQFFDLPNGLLGVVQVAYLEEMPQADEGPFLYEERKLLEATGEKIRTYLKSILSDQAINRQLAELETLYESGLVISQLRTPTEIAREVIGVLERRMNWHHISIREYHPAANSVKLIGFNKSGISTAEAEEHIEKINSMISNPAQGLSGWVTIHGKSTRVSDVKKDSRYITTFSEINSGLYVPLKIGERVIGSISVESELENAFTENDERLLETLAGQAAVAIENANLLTELQSELIERRIIEEEVRHLNAELEERVEERTAQTEAIKRRLELATHAGHIGVWEYNPKENRVIWDERMHMIHHLQQDEFAGTYEAWEKFIYPSNPEKSKMNPELEFAENLLLNNEHRILLPNGDIRHIATNAITVFAEDNTPNRIIGISIDITEQKNLEEALKLANAEMERALQVKDEFLANMSHELRTPLNAILGISESLEEQVIGDLNEKQAKYVGVIKESGRHLLELINDILDISKIEAGRMELDFRAISVEKLCQASLRMIKELAQKKSLQTSFKIHGKVKTILGDERRLKQVLVNLLSNAVKFTETGKEMGIEVTGNAKQNEVIFSVWDNGIGIAHEDLKYLFKPFVQLDAGLSREYQGTGLGLALVAQMVRLHGGRVSAKSEIGKGSQFIVTLPWQPEEQNASLKQTGELVAPKVKTQEKRKGKVLVIEDTDVIIALVKDYLTHKGYDVVVAHNGHEGILMAKEHHPDIMLMDVMMPIMDGIEATKEIRKDSSLQSTPIIALTALAMPGDRERCMEAGMTDYMSKPVKLNELTEMIEKHLSGH